MYIREIPRSVVFGMDENREIFNLHGGLYIPNIRDVKEAQEYFWRDLNAVLRHWFKNNGRQNSAFINEYYSVILAESNQGGRSSDQNDK